MRSLFWMTLLLGGMPVLASQPLYTETEIAAPSGATLNAVGLNNNGDIAGNIGGSIQNSAFVYIHHSQTLTFLPHPQSGSFDAATGINDYGKVSGWFQPSNQAISGVAWYLSGGFDLLPGMDRGGIATAVSNNGRVTGIWGNYHGFDEAVYWSWRPTLHSTYVAGLPDSNCCYPHDTARAINDAGNIVGDSSITTATTSGDHAYLYIVSSNTTTDLGVLGTNSPYNEAHSAAYGLNNHNDVVGESDVAVPNCANCAASHAFLWQAGKLKDLGNLGNVPAWNSSANAINDSDEIVGTAAANVNGQPTARAFVYTGGTMYNLTFFVYNRDPDVRLVDAVGINCNGWIVANGYNTANPATNRVYLLIPKNNPLRAGCPQPR
jgi:probable HAF family extracellular repeat protein